MSNAALRDQIALFLSETETRSNTNLADDLVAIVRAHATSDAPVDAACKVLAERALGTREYAVRGAIMAALGGKT